MGLGFGFLIGGGGGGGGCSIFVSYFKFFLK